MANAARGLKHKAWHGKANKGATWQNTPLSRSTASHKPTPKLRRLGTAASRLPHQVVYLSGSAARRRLALMRARTSGTSMPPQL